MCLPACADVADMTTDIAALENLFLGLADKTRLRLLTLMADGPVPVGHLVSKTGLSQPKVSRHLAYLRNAGLVDTSRDGKRIYYGLAVLEDPSADEAFKCVIGELSGGGSHLRERQTGSRKAREAARPLPEAIHHEEPVSQRGDLALDEDWESEALQEPVTDERPQELEVFLL